MQATTSEGLDLIKSQYKDVTTQYLSKMADGELYLAATNGQTYGRSASQLAESGGASMNNFRRSYPVTGLAHILRDEFDRHLKHSKDANAQNYPLTPSAAKHLAQLKADREAMRTSCWTNSDSQYLG